MRARTLRLLCLLPLLGLVGCDIRLDPDTLVRELRVLGGRVGAAEPGSVADLDILGERLLVRALVAAPTGPGRRVPAPRPVTIDAYLCLSARSILVPSAIDPACAQFGPKDPDPKRGDNPALLYLTSGPADAALEVPLGPLRAELAERLLPFFRMGRMGGMGGGIPEGPLQLLLPVVLRVQAGGSTDPLDSETAFLFARLVFAPPGQTAPPPNRNPVLRGLWAGAEPPAPGQEPAGAPLTPCPADGPCTPLRVARDGEVHLTALPAPGSAELYRPLDESGREQVTETLRFSWFATDGEFSEPRTGGSSYTTRWRNSGDYAAPDAVRIVDLYVVLQEERGGAAWAHYQLELD